MAHLKTINQKISSSVLINQ